MKIRISKADKVFADYIKARDNYRCVIHGKQYSKGDRGLHCGHIFTRAKKSVRWVEENAVAICMRCNIFWETTWGHKWPTIKDWAREKMGEEEFNRLQILANIPKAGLDETMAYLVYKEKLKEATNGNIIGVGIVRGRRNQTRAGGYKGGRCS